MRRFAMIAVSMSLMLGLSEIPRLFAQDAPKQDTTKTDAPKPDTPPTATPKTDAPKADATKADGAPAADAPLPPIPPEVEAKLEAARHAVAEAIVAAQDAGLVQTTIDPPPILDILVTGRAIDERNVRARTGVSTEVFGAWFTGYGKLEGFAHKDVRINQPSTGLKQLYDQRANILNRHIEAVRKARGPAPAPKAEESPKEEPKKEEPKKEEPKKEEVKEAPKAEETKPEAPKTEEPKKEAPKTEAPKTEEPKKAEEPKKEESKPEAPKAEEPKKEEAKPEAPKAEEPKAEEPKKEEPQ